MTRYVYFEALELVKKIKIYVYIYCAHALSTAHPQARNNVCVQKVHILKYVLKRLMGHLARSS